jgi:hypothetical protein
MEKNNEFKAETLIFNRDMKRWELKHKGRGNCFPCGNQNSNAYYCKVKNSLQCRHCEDKDTHSSCYVVAGMNNQPITQHEHFWCILKEVENDKTE